MTKPALVRLKKLVKKFLNGTEQERPPSQPKLKTADNMNFHASKHGDYLYSVPSLHQLFEEETQTTHLKLVEEHEMLIDYRVLLVGYDYQRNLELVSWFEELGAVVVHTTNFDWAEEAISENPKAWGILVVEMDQMLNEQETIASLLLARAMVPELPIILATRHDHCDRCFADLTEICTVWKRGLLCKSSYKLLVIEAIDRSHTQSRI
ncbi:response regulator [Parasedimentitalea marina]|uniref:Response regulator n=1 Tax=Parasedimentitalea marina TaxID=2483033 RepID=A0A3T0N4V8_9RHOB|nr:response regulator [Parasedimentitalea marina]AZV79022.1 response regulator [Parasedimentitalea marina]